MAYDEWGNWEDDVEEDEYSPVEETSENTSDYESSMQSFSDDEDGGYEDEGPYDGPLSPWEEEHGGVPYEEPPPSGGGGGGDTPPPSPPQTPAEREKSVLDEIEKWYQETLGRGMDAGERATEYGQYQRSGGEGLRAQLRQRAGNSPGGQPRSPSGSGTGTGRPSGSGSGGGGGSQGFSFDPGPFNGPVARVGEDPFSQLITGGYLDLLSNRGQTPFGGEMEQYLRGLLERGGEIDEDPSLYAQRAEAARQPVEAFRRMQTNQGRAELADRGLISEPGQPQGVEAGFLRNLDESLAPYYATAGQNLASDMARQRGERYDRALALGTGFASQQAQDYLNALRGGTERQGTLSDIALGTLDRNMSWNRFLAEFGMDRDIALETLQGGRIDDVNELLDLFKQYVEASQGGYR